MAEDDPRWELAYPHRDELFDVRRWTSLDVTRAQISAAFLIEKLARAYMGGRQMTGVQTHKRFVLVDDIETVRVIQAAFAASTPTNEAQAWIDRALGCLRQCFTHGMAVLMWDRPGYDEITDSFQSLLTFASDPNHIPLELAWERPTSAIGRPSPRRPRRRRSSTCASSTPSLLSRSSPWSPSSGGSCTTTADAQKR